MPDREGFAGRILNGDKHGERVQTPTKFELVITARLLGVGDEVIE